MAENTISKINIGGTEYDLKAATSDALNANAGSATQPVYFANGVPVKTTYTLGASVPSGAKFTDTVYTLPVATSSALGGVKSGTDITVDSSGNVSVNNNSHTHTIANVTSLSDTLGGKADINHDHDAAYDTKGAAAAALTAAQSYADSAASTAAAAVKSDLLNGAEDAYDTLKELGALIDTNTTAIDALEEVAASKANASDLTAHTGNKSNPHSVTAAQTKALALAGGTLNDGASIKLSKYGNRYLTIDGNAITADLSNCTGGWAGSPLSVKDPAGDTTTLLGWYGGVDGLTHIYMGGAYNDPYMKMTKAGQFTFKNTPKVGSTSVSLDGHTHSYAGSSSVGGSATSAVKLDTETAGSEIHPVYFKDGKPVATTYTLNANVPSNAVFTDTNTKVTSVDNHYAPSANSSYALSVDASSTTSASWGSTDLVTGVNIQRDAKGHVTGLTVDSIQMPTNPNSDTKVTQTVTTTNASYPLLLAPSGQTSTQTTTSYFDSGVTLNPSTNTIAANISGSAATATTATKLGSSTVGGYQQPIFLSAGTATACTKPASGSWFNGGLLNLNSDGTTEIGRYIDFHYATTSTNDYDVRIDCAGTSQNIIYLPAVTGQVVVHTNDTAIGSTTKPVYIAASGVATACSTYAGGTKVTLNNSSKGGSTASFYAPTAGGTSGYILTGAGTTSAPTWSSTIAASKVAAGTLAGRVDANATATATLANLTLRNIYIKDTDMTAGSTSLTTGAICLVYE